MTTERGNTTLATIIRSADHLRAVQKSSVGSGDWVFVKTVGSMYQIRVLGGGVYEVSGGWFARKGRTAVRLKISGCTWGGSAIKIDLVAACGLRIEFANRLITSPVQAIFVVPKLSQN